MSCVRCYLLFIVGWRYIDTLFFFLMIRRPPRSTLDRSSAASDVYKRQVFAFELVGVLLLAALIGAVVLARKD